MEPKRGASGPATVAPVAAILVTILLLAGLKSFFVVLPGLGVQNWLRLLFRINLGQTPVGALRMLNPIDFAILALVGVTFSGLWPFLARGRRIWISIAVALPFAGMLVLFLTHLAGRSAVMGAGLIVSFLMLRTPGFRGLSYLGILANGLLLAADFATAGSRLLPVAISVGVGYFALIAWFIWIAIAAWRRSRHT